jgi:hypothetical protein
MTGKKKQWYVPAALITLGMLLIIFVLAAPAQEPRLFRLEDFGGAFVFFYEYTGEMESYAGEVDRDISRTYLEGGIQLDTEGSVYHPNFLSFQAKANILANRTKSQFFSDSSINNDINNTYDIRLHFLKKKTLNLQLYAIRHYFSFDRAFYERYFSSLSSVGLTLNSQARRFPFTLNAYINGMKSESLTYPERDEQSKNVDFKVNLLDVKKTNSKLTFKFKDYSESVYDIDFQSMDLMANFQHFYNTKGSGGSDSFLSVLNVRRMRGDSDFSSLGFFNTARYHFRKNLYARGEYKLVKDEAFNRSSTQHNITGYLNHKLFESLDTMLMAGGRFERSTRRDADVFRYGVTFNYRKKIPTGVFRLTYVNRQENGQYRSRGSSDNTSYRMDFSASDTIVITRIGIDVDTIVVTDPNYAHIYVRGVDYHVTSMQNIVTITRLPGGAILPGASVLVHFEFLTAPDYNLKLNMYRLDVNLQVLKRFHFFYRKAINDPVTISDYTVVPFEDYNKTTFGGKFLTRFLRAEYYRETYDSSRSNYVSNNYRVAGNLSIGRFLRLSADVAINRLNYQPEVFFSHLDAYTGECSLFLSPRLTFRGMYRKIDYSIPGLSRERESIIVRANWAFRRIIVELFYERIFSGSLLMERERDYFTLMIRRTF